MPNGERVPYRVESGLPPSPAHTSDSETTEEQKTEWWAIRIRLKIIANRLLPRIIIQREEILWNIARFL